MDDYQRVESVVERLLHEAATLATSSTVMDSLVQRMASALRTQQAEIERLRGVATKLGELVEMGNLIVPMFRDSADEYRSLNNNLVLELTTLRAENEAARAAMVDAVSVYAEARDTDFDIGFNHAMTLIRRVLAPFTQPEPTDRKDV